MAGTGLLVVRAWIEAGSSSPLRVNMRSTTEVSEGFQREANFADAAAAGVALRVWLEALEEVGRPNGDAP
jgi:hypothetical protein